jgi:serine/threonine-protein kinase
MTTKSGAGSAALTLSLERQVNAACRRFEAAWRAGGRPRLEDYLADCPEPARPALLAELLALELAYRDQGGEAPAAEEYCGRFPGHEAIIDDAFRGPDPSTTVRPRSAPESVTAPEEAPRPAAPDGAEDGPPAVPGYEVLGRLGKGGMAVVWGGHDRRLRRAVAVKVMKEELAGWPHLERRFMEEAQLTSQLAHPAIPPVHELGELSDGRPYFVMKLVQGRTLADLLDARTGPADDLPRFLTIFEQVCQAVAYAHSKGVIHRDLKPANVMVGAFGEVQVMDWGLAKLLADQPPEAAAADPAGGAVATVRTAGPDDATQEGSMLGTPAYMAPEQARGEVERVDRRCDVFGLGAILCEVLTGQPPYVGAAEDVRVQAQLGHLGPARERLAACGADAELVALAGRCLGARPEGRPADAGEVAAAVAAHLAGVQERLRKAELERAAAQARAAAERKARRRTRALAAALLTLVIVGGGGTAWWWHERTAVVRDTEAALAEAARDQAAGRWSEAGAALREAAGRLGGAGPADLRRRLDVARAKLELVDRLDRIRQRRAINVRGKFYDRAPARDYAAEFREAGLGDVGDDVEAVAERVRASGVAGPLVAALDDWALVALATRDRETARWLLAVARQADPDAWGKSFHDLGVWQDQGKLQALAQDALRDDGAKLNEVSPQVLAALGSQLDRSPEAVLLLREAQRRYPKDFWLSLYLGAALLQANQYEEAVGYYRVAVTLRPDAAAAHNDLGLALHGKHDLEGAIAEYRTAIRLDSQLAAAHNNLGSALRDNKDLKGAIAAYEKATELAPNYTLAYYNLGLARHDNKDLKGAIAAYKKATELDRDYADAYLNLGCALYASGEIDGALSAFGRAVILTPNDARAHYNLGNARRAKGDLDGAVVAYRKALDIDPDYPEAHCNLGQVLSDQGRFAEALKELSRGHELGSKLPGWNNKYKSADWVRVCEHLIELDKKLPAVLNGTVEPAGVAERLEFADLCRQYRRLPVAAARLSADAFAGDLAHQDHYNHYNAACAAALGAAGLGDDAQRLPDKVVLMLRRQSLGWLRQDLALCAKQADGVAEARELVRRRLAYWQQDADLASVREPAALETLPDDERRAWRLLWQEVDALRKRVEDNK